MGSEFPAILTADNVATKLKNYKLPGITEHEIPIVQLFNTYMLYLVKVQEQTDDNMH